ncbi:fungal-specific transcription factor-like protein [Venturia nashicola]|uniref:Fungal-specific transcription factor-like protein n=1 Tax=Venturia nashicola TaxID=86259 RepID=A0A4Z1PHS0_9PEZI|nr:fungal-specific transcription factor-like protein [Venturia nashicola]
MDRFGSAPQDDRDVYNPNPLVGIAQNRRIAKYIMNGTSNHSSPEDSSSKRKRSEGSKEPQQRAKRNRYISIACNECKRRKIKCNGQTPCQRCGNLSLECLYAPNCCGNSFKDSDEFKQMMGQISSLQQSVDSLYSNLNSLRSQVDNGGIALDASPYGQSPYPPLPDPSNAGLMMPSQSTPAPKHPKFRGPTSALFNLGVARSSLVHMGLAGDEGGEDELMTHDGTPSGSPPPNQRPVLHASKDAIWSLNKDEAIRLIYAWQDEMGTMYPIVDIEGLVRHTGMLFTFMEAARRSRLMDGSMPGADAIYDDQTNLLKLIVAVALTLEGSGKSELGKRMWESVRTSVEAQLFDAPDLKGLQMLALAAMYHFHCDDESLAWRLIGQGARLAVEIGLHRHETYANNFTTDEERQFATVLFWSLYVLDRRWSFGTGMPFALQDADIDALLPKTDQNTPYLTAMVAYSAIGSKVWQRVANADANRSALSGEEMGYLDYQVLQWHRSLPESLSYIRPDSLESEEKRSRSDTRLRINMYCRSNQMRILIYRPVLHSATSIAENLTQAHTVVDVAKETIRILTHMNQSTDLYRTQQVMFNYFLISALAVLFLAVSHAATQFSNRCRDEFYMALDIVRGMTAHSYVSKRLWRTIKMLKEVGPKLGLNVRNPVVDNTEAAVAMVGLAGNPVDEMALFGNGSNSMRMNDSPNGMANDLTSLFEAAGGYSTIMPNTSNSFGVSSDAIANNGEGVFGQHDELARILRDLF